MRFLTRKPVKGRAKAPTKAAAKAQDHGAPSAQPARPRSIARASAVATGPGWPALPKGRNLAWGGGASLLVAFAGSLVWAVYFGLGRAPSPGGDRRRLDGLAMTARWGLAVSEVFGQRTGTAPPATRC